jgi:hypothetical protein
MQEHTNGKKINLRKWILDNICVQQPYFDLGEVEEERVEGDKDTIFLRSEVSCTNSPYELSEVSFAEIGRHLAILGIFLPFFFFFFFFFVFLVLLLFYFFNF